MYYEALSNRLNADGGQGVSRYVIAIAEGVIATRISDSVPEQCVFCAYSLPELC